MMSAFQFNFMVSVLMLQCMAIDIVTCEILSGE